MTLFEILIAWFVAKVIAGMPIEQVPARLRPRVQAELDGMSQEPIP